MKLAMFSATAALVIVGTQVANAQQCAELHTAGIAPLQGLASFSALVTTTYSGTNSCGGRGTCTYTCQSSVNVLGGRVWHLLCPVWVPHWGDWCWNGGGTFFTWTNRSGRQSLEIPNIPNASFSNSVSATLTFAHPAVQYSGGYGVAITGGHLVSSGTQFQRYFNTGDVAQVVSTDSWNGGGFSYLLCTDQDANGKCDEYDTVARAFGDFDGSGAVDGGDLAFLLGQWGASGPLGDLDGSGIVGGGDLAILLGRWGQEV